TRTALRLEDRLVVEIPPENQHGPLRALERVGQRGEIRFAIHQHRRPTRHHPSPAVDTLAGDRIVRRRRLRRTLLPCVIAHHVEIGKLESVSVCEAPRAARPCAWWSGPRSRAPWPAHTARRTSNRKRAPGDPAPSPR